MIPDLALFLPSVFSFPPSLLSLFPSTVSAQSRTIAIATASIFFGFILSVSLPLVSSDRSLSTADDHRRGIYVGGRSPQLFRVPALRFLTAVISFPGPSCPWINYPAGRANPPNRAAVVEGVACGISAVSSPKQSQRLQKLAWFTYAGPVQPYDCRLILDGTSRLYERPI